MRLRPVEKTDTPLVAGWLADPETCQWLDFGGGQQSLSASALTIMLQRDLHCLRLLEAPPEHVPVGLVALSHIAPRFRTATLWYLLGRHEFRRHGYATRGVGEMLTCGFGELGLEAISAWAVETNVGSIRVLERNGFRPIGRQRRCHWIEGRVYDRLWFDLLASEHDPDRVAGARFARSGAAPR